MYGRHITDNWDRITNNAYLKTLIKPELLNVCNLAKNSNLQIQEYLIMEHIWNI